MANDLIISDGEFIQAEKILMSYVDSLNECGAEFVRIIDELIQNINSPEVEASLANLSQAMSVCVEPVASLKSDMEGQAITFIQDVDDTDQFIY